MVLLGTFSERIRSRNLVLNIRFKGSKRAFVGFISKCNAFLKGALLLPITLSCRALHSAFEVLNGSLRIRWIDKGS